MDVPNHTPEAPPLRKGALVLLLDYGAGNRATARLVTFRNRVTGRTPLEAWLVQLLPAGGQENRVVDPRNALTPEAAAELVECPACSAAGGGPCTVYHRDAENGNGGPIQTPHTARYQAAGVGGGS